MLNECILILMKVNLNVSDLGICRIHADGQDVLGTDTADLLLMYCFEEF